jgi:hypothetical protein
LGKWLNGKNGNPDSGFRIHASGKKSQQQTADSKEVLCVMCDLEEKEVPE